MRKKTKKGIGVVAGIGIAGIAGAILYNKYGKGFERGEAPVGSDESPPTVPTVTVGDVPVFVDREYATIQNLQQQYASVYDHEREIAAIIADHRAAIIAINADPAFVSAQASYATALTAAFNAQADLDTYNMYLGQLNTEHNYADTHFFTTAGQLARTYPTYFNISASPVSETTKGPLGYTMLFDDWALYGGGLYDAIDTAKAETAKANASAAKQTALDAQSVAATLMQPFTSQVAAHEGQITILTTELTTVIALLNDLKTALRNAGVLI